MLLTARLAVRKRRGNSNCVRPRALASTPAGASTFEHFVATLGLAPEKFKDSAVLKEWVRKNKDVRYVPSELLQTWGLTVDGGWEANLPGRHHRISPRSPLD